MHTLNGRSGPAALGLLLMVLVACRPQVHDELFPVAASPKRVATSAVTGRASGQASDMSRDERASVDAALAAMARAYFKAASLEDRGHLLEADTILVVSAYRIENPTFVADTVRAIFRSQIAGYLVADSAGSAAHRRRFVARFAIESEEHSARRVDGEWVSARTQNRPFVFAAALSGRSDLFTLSEEDWKRIDQLFRAE